MTLAVNQLNSDYTFSSNSGSTGTWSLSGNKFTQYFSNGTIYWGTVNATFTYMNGTMLDYDGDTGCWSANRTGYASPFAPIQVEPGSGSEGSSGSASKK